MRRKYRKNNHIEINELVQKALTARKESKHFDFKSSCALDESGTWCEIVKDIVAMAEKSLYCADVVICLQKMSGKTVAEGMGSYSFCEFCPPDRLELRHNIVWYIKHGY